LVWFYLGRMLSFDSRPTTAYTISTGTEFDPDMLAAATNYGGFVGYSFSSLTTGATDYSATGVSYGVGVMITDRIFLGAEYLARDLQGVNITTPGSDVRIDGVIQSAAIRIGMKF